MYRVLREQENEKIAQAGAAFILLSGGIFHTSGVINRADSLAIAFLSLATLYRDRKTFILWLGLAVASKQLALFAVPWFFFDRKYTTKTLLAGLVTPDLVPAFLVGQRDALRPAARPSAAREGRLGGHLDADLRVDGPRARGRDRQVEHPFDALGHLGDAPAGQGSTSGRASR